MRQMFNNMDTDNSGTITLEELRIGLSRLGSQLTEPEVRELLDAVRIEAFDFYCYLGIKFC
jgi:calcium-dependent protein kinase